jgi:hypothetical protein
MNNTVLFKVHLRGRVSKTIQVYTKPDASLGEVLWNVGVQLRGRTCATACLPTCDPIDAHVRISDIPGCAVCVPHADKCVRHVGWVQPSIQDIADHFKPLATWLNGERVPQVLKCTGASLSDAMRLQNRGVSHCVMALVSAHQS